ncbi:bifunctional 2-C-methyl-D-erythritol 4-phosphate cytidylyltransferase/2-C-methyl-D-erythritol 2,4-cyclodiphosphate synthase [Oceanomicrobium pacificus]|uniref:Bifunctional enzyme IspD/IspF n=1 Tax=Oceanomicrobium pacificus TaxID=2692916 RepID=A0A6B0TMM4_9RHOB|nr:bifunctional 2-C-methyl-D-erythritol 4-phosphate cytidylyltransferase/2-C-methyl-D-erythritol 2,4-cyclodiphosphate synthase [Oceanomicrobium pacificus]MXU65767.1 bifunctional 2-C-methyl-D-erythritol 4-phosphate cytidylyltransferase/2-C-methyl-D-erythritol 2,4-cyclodiphosphate synthase [Oceanomicrobium pacificus]
MTIDALIVAAGRGTRAGDGPPKQYRMLAGEMVLTRAIRALLAAPRVRRVLTVIHPDDAALFARAVDGLPEARITPWVAGGADRAASVAAGLDALAAGDAPDHVLIHDAARPFLSRAILDATIDAMLETGAACPALPVVDALWAVEDGRFAAPRDRTGLVRAQTPQAFAFPAIRAVHATHQGEAHDDVAVAVSAGMAVAFVPGAEENYKLTTAEDFARAEKALRQMTGDGMDFRCGNGFDVHAFGPGSSVTLCGVTVPHERGLSGHSDADVAMHAVTDALFGAIAEGDIGQWFPPSEAEWKGADSALFLRKAVERVAARGYRIANIDCTIICEQPKIGPHAKEMRARMAALTGIDEDRVSVKATTSERLGFTGRSEGIAAMASAALVAA